MNAQGGAQTKQTGETGELYRAFEQGLDKGALIEAAVGAWVAYFSPSPLPNLRRPIFGVAVTRCEPPLWAGVMANTTGVPRAQASHSHFPRCRGLARLLHNNFNSMKQILRWLLGVRLDRFAGPRAFVSGMTMQKQLRHNRIIALCLGVAIFAFAGWANADPPTRAARLGYIGGAVSFSPAGEDDWVWATVNRPVINGDRLWADAGARAELQAGHAMIRMSGSTSVTVLNLDDGVVQLQLAQGTLNLHVRRFEADDVLEIDTPNLAFSIRQPGDYRIDVDSTGDATSVVTRSGRAEVYGEGAAYVVDAQKSYRFFGTGLRDYEEPGLLPADGFDRWAYERDRRWESSVSSRYVSPDVIGYQDLDEYGTWRVDAGYGNVWVPNRVSVGWAPYHDGHWTWIDPWGWTGGDDAPRGFAVSHYGRWTDLSGTWGWVPGPVGARAIYAPALVAFVGGRNFQLSISTGNVAGIAWFPLGPRDVYRPTYAVSRGYYTNINTSNTVINNTQITNVYKNTKVTNATYLNQQVPGAVIAVPATAFVQSQAVSKAAVRMPKEMVVNAPVTPVAAVAPVKASVLGAAAAAGSKPPAAVLERPVVAKRAPPAAPVGFASKEHLLATDPGKPLDAAALGALKQAAPVAAAKIQVVAPAQAARPIAAPPVPRAQPEQRGKLAEPPVATPAAPRPPPVAAPPDQRGPSEQRGKPAEPPVATPVAPRPPPVAAPPDQRGPSEQRGKPAEPPVATPVAPRPPPVAAPPDQRGPSEQRGKPAEPPVATPVAPRPPPVAAPPGEPPAAKAPPPAAPPAAPPEPAGKADQRDKQPKTDAARSENKKSDEQLRLEEEEKKRKP